MKRKRNENQSFLTGLYIGLFIGLVCNLFSNSFFMIVKDQSQNFYWTLFIFSFILILILLFLFWRISKGEGTWD